MFRLDWNRTDSADERATHRLLLTTYCLLLTAYYIPLTTCYLLLTAYCSLLTTCYLLLTTYSFYYLLLIMLMNVDGAKRGVCM